ncbi:hypothetical protein QRZ34_27490 [Klebsiella michiganensis]|jgi:hypothetical protein|uniref:hypothetical protein n=1 Tax=Klebsiella michiganensis TaxID=1134687 RepID=UPI002570B2F8|nr:hypothetical protein [Klebsiella michiganensis]MDL4454778.1 hypothetical protein [Klebsiella michiganensis]
MWELAMAMGLLIVSLYCLFRHRRHRRRLSLRRSARSVRCPGHCRRRRSAASNKGVVQ